LATENYSRPSWIQTVKFLVARVHYELTGTLPDISLGLGQIKPKTAAKILRAAESGSTVSQWELWRRLRGTCESVQIVYFYFDQLLADVEVNGELRPLQNPTIRARVVDAVRRYNGQASNPSRRGVEDASDVYSTVVLQLAEWLEEGP